MLDHTLMIDGPRKIVFGDASYPIDRDNLASYVDALRSLQARLPAESVTFVRQRHGTQAVVCDDSISRFLVHDKEEGDILLTNTPGRGLGVLTGDCLPVVLYDRTSKATALIHAGWKGTMQGVLQKAAEALVFTYGDLPQNLVAVFGPSAKVCCYEVQQDFVDRLVEYNISTSRFVKQRDHKFYFDLPKANAAQLLSFGVKETSIDLCANECTMCNTRFCSFRREGGTMRNASLVCI